MMSRTGRVLKFVIIGDGGVGKTTLTKVFCENTYIDQIMTIGIDIHTKESVVDGQKTTLQIWDISGQRQFVFLLADFIRSANGVVLAFDCSRKATFLNLDEWIELIRTYEPNVPIFLIATKLDEGYHPSLSKESVMEFVKKKNLIGFEETSAKQHTNVEIPWRRLIENFLGFAPDSVPLTFSSSEMKPKPAAPKLSARDAPLFKPISPFHPPSKPEIPANVAVTSKPVAIPLTNPLNSPGHVNSPSPMNLPASEVGSRSGNFITKCPHCNTILRESQIKLKMEGKQVFCRGCLKLI